MDYFNEVKLILIMYHILTFTAFVPDPETKHNIGYSCAAILIIGIVVNMSMLFI